MMGSFVHCSLFLIRDSTKTGLQIRGVVYRVLELKATILSHLSWLCLWIGFHFLCLYIHNDTIAAFGEQDKQLLIEPVFGQVLQGSSGKALLPKSLANISFLAINNYALLFTLGCRALMSSYCHNISFSPWSA